MKKHVWLHKGLAGVLAAALAAGSVGEGAVLAASVGENTGVYEEDVVVDFGEDVEVEECDSALAYAEAVTALLAANPCDFVEEETEEDYYQTNRLIIRDADGFSDTYGAETVVYYDGEYMLQYATTADTMAAYEAFAADETIDELYVDAVISVAEDADLSVASLSNTSDGQYLSWGVAAMGLDTMQEELTSLGYTENNEVIVAVIDTGVYAANTYLEGRVLSGLNCSQVNERQNKTSTDTTDDNGHGTHVAGTIVDGTSENVMILPIKAMDAKGDGTLSAVAVGITYALEQGADVINLSVAGEDEDRDWDYLDAYFEKAVAENCVIVCAAGNSSADVSYWYPANNEDVFTVGGLSQRGGELVWYSDSNYGSAIDFTAPGSSITSTIIGTSATGSKSGTSMAAPHVSAAVALVKTYYQAMGLTPSNAAIKAELIEYCQDLGMSGWDEYFGYGCINLASFMSDHAMCTITKLANKAGGVKITWTAVSGADGYYVYRETGDGEVLVATITDGSTVTYKDTEIKSANNTECTYSVVPYFGSATGDYETAKIVRLVAPKVSSLASDAGSISIKWKKKSGVTGYQIQYSTSSSFASSKTTKVKVKGAASVKKVLKGLKKGKKYYIRIRSYKTVSGTTYYSAWSSTKTVKVKK